MQGVMATKDYLQTFLTYDLGGKKKNELRNWKKL